MQKEISMLQSMTGYGKSEIAIEGKKITIEIKSLNSKTLDLSVRMPGFYREKETEYRTQIAKEVGRGKVDFSIYVEKSSASRPKSINKELAKQYHLELKELSELLEESNTHLLSQVLKMPEVITSEPEEIPEDELLQLSVGVSSAISNFTEFRKQEGAVLENELITRINNIESLLEEVVPFEEERINRVKERIQNNLIAAIEESKIDKNRFEQELIYYIEKFDITEEKVRLKSHCSYFLETAKNEEAQGKKLGFITQEIGREINTLGSKANHDKIQKIVVQMKDELEKIKEQTLNIL